MSELTDELALRLASVTPPLEFALVALEHGVHAPRIGAVARARLALR